jgi:hypothetical protein
MLDRRGILDDAPYKESALAQVLNTDLLQVSLLRFCKTIKKEATAVLQMNQSVKMNMRMKDDDKPPYFMLCRLSLGNSSMILQLLFQSSLTNCLVEHVIHLLSPFSIEISRSSYMHYNMARELPILTIS